MEEKNSLSNQPLPVGRNIDSLREQGIEQISRLSSVQWSDYNLSDPGMIVLEQLCYAITDLGMRIAFDINDLLTPSDIDINRDDAQFFKPSQVMTCEPISRNDLRRLIIDVDGVSNAWFETVTRTESTLYWDELQNRITHLASDDTTSLPLHGLYRVVVEPQASLPDDAIATLGTTLRALLHQHRSLCEDFVDVIVLPVENIRLRAAFDITSGVEPEKILAQCVLLLEPSIARTIQSKTYDNLKNDNYSLDRIYQGPLLTNGFITEHDLVNGQYHGEIRVSDLMGILRDIPDLMAIREMSIGIENPDYSYSDQRIDWHKWVLPLSSARAVRLSDISTNWEQLSLTFYKSGNACPLDEERYLFWREHFVQNAQSESAQQSDPDRLPRGRYRELGHYRSLQEELPLVFGVGKDNDIAGISDQRAALRSQLQAYLAIFDHVLSAYIRQLQHAKDLLSVSANWDSSYFSTPLTDIAGSESILAEDYSEQATLLNESLDIDDNGERINRILDHLLARMGERFTDQSLLQLNNEDYLDAKRHYLRNSARLISQRSLGFNRLGQSFWDTDEIAGFSERISALLGIKNAQRRSLAVDDNVEEGFHCLENILLRPLGIALDSITVLDDKIVCESTDHRLKSGSVIELYSAVGIDGEYRVIAGDGSGSSTPAIDNNFFVIDRSLQAFWAPLRQQVITIFNDNAQGGIRCWSNSHGLKTGELILLSINGDSRGKWLVQVVDENTFDIPMPYSVRYKNARGQWQRHVEDVIDRFIVGTGMTTCRTKPHALVAGDRLSLFLTGSSDPVGEHEVVTVPDDQSFTVSEELTPADGLSGRWQLISQQSITKMMATQLPGELEGDDHVATMTCTSAAHPLLVGDHIDISLGGRFMGKRLIQAVDGDTFEIEGQLPGRWRRVQNTVERMQDSVALISEAHGLTSDEHIELTVDGDDAGAFPVITNPFVVDTFYISAPKNRDKTTADSIIQWQRVNKTDGAFWQPDEVLQIWTEGAELSIGDSISLRFRHRQLGDAVVNQVYPNGGINLVYLDQTFPINVSWRRARDGASGAIYAVARASLILGPGVGDATVLLAPDNTLDVGDQISIYLDSTWVGDYTVPVQHIIFDTDSLMLDVPVDINVYWRPVVDDVQQAKIFPLKNTDLFVAPGHELNVGDLFTYSELDGTRPICSVLELPDSSGDPSSGQQRDSFTGKNLQAKWGKVNNIDEFVLAPVSEGVTQITTTKAHSFIVGETVNLSDAGVFNGSYRVMKVTGEQHFSINRIFPTETQAPIVDTGLLKSDNSTLITQVALIDSVVSQRWLQIRVNSHQISTQDPILLSGSDDEINGRYSVIARTESDVTLDKIAADDLDVAMLSGYWSLIEESPILYKNHSGGTTCIAPMHALIPGDAVYLFDTGYRDQFDRYIASEYDGQYVVKQVDDNGFAIDRTFIGVSGELQTTKNPYSLQVTFVFPNWIGRYTSPDFRLLVEDVIRKETPAHIATKVFWIDVKAMEDFELYYQQWLYRQSEGDFSSTQQQRLANNLLKKIV
jgi:hypothetical protein